jgi:MFS family permease
LLNFVTLAIQLATSNKGVLYLGRILLGFSNGFLVTFSNVYISEISPAHLRGVMVALFAWWVNIGSIWGTVVDNYTQTLLDMNSYRIPIACLYVVPTILGIGLFVVPESPRWLLHRNCEPEARKAFEQLRSDSVSLEYLELEWAEMIRGVDEEKRAAKSIAVWDMFRGM